MREVIPAPVIAIVAEVVSERETHASLDSLFMYAGAPGEPPEGSKHVKALERLRRTNKDSIATPLEVLGTIIEGYMDADPTDKSIWGADILAEHQRKTHKAFERGKLHYFSGGKVGGSLSTPTISLEQHIKDKDIDSVNEEFSRALRSVTSEPRNALSAACNILESVFKVYIESKGLDMPSKKDIKGTWSLVRKNVSTSTQSR